MNDADITTIVPVVGFIIHDSDHYQKCYLLANGEVWYLRNRGPSGSDNDLGVMERVVRRKR